MKSSTALLKQSDTWETGIGDLLFRGCLPGSQRMKKCGREQDGGGEGRAYVYMSQSKKIEKTLGALAEGW